MISKYDKDGRYLSISNRTLINPNHPPPPEVVDEGVAGFFEGVVDLSSQYHDFLTDTPHAMGERPSDSHVFNYKTKRWNADLDRAWELVKIERRRLLAACDWVTIRAAESGSPVPPEWITYRQALRDVTLQTDPEQIQWPQEP